MNLYKVIFCILRLIIYGRFLWKCSLWRRGHNRLLVMLKWFQIKTPIKVQYIVNWVLHILSSSLVWQSFYCIKPEILWFISLNQPPRLHPLPLEIRKGTDYSYISIKIVWNSNFLKKNKSYVSYSNHEDAKFGWTSP